MCQVLLVQVDTGRPGRRSSNIPSFHYPLFIWMKTNLIVFSVFQAREVDKDRVKLLHQNGPLAPLTFEICHITCQAVARSDKSFERVLRNLDFLQIDVQ